jgi:hypothetical protein
VSPKNIALAVCGGLVALGILGLFLEVREAPARPSPEKVEDARKKHRARQTAPTPHNVVDDPWARGTADAQARDLARDRGEPKDDAEPVVRDGPRFGGPIGDRGLPPEMRRPPVVGTVPDVDNDPRLEISTLKDEANRMYDKQDFDGAIAAAAKVLDKEPGDIRMLRVLVSSHCQAGDADKAQQYWNQLPDHDRNAMNRRCQRFGITFKE